MRIFHSEFAHDYKTYAFGYQVHAELEPGESAEEAYAHGFLPRSNEPDRHNRFYLARSVRVPTEQFSLTTENRRIVKKFEGRFTETFLSREELSKSAEFKSFFLSYFNEKHGIGIMSEERLEGILASVLPIRGIRYLDGSETVGYALEAADGPFLHYWYPVYRPDMIGAHLGMWMMLDAVRRAKDEGRAYAYLGTAYGEKGRYKMNIEPIEFWDGEGWKQDANALKALLKSEATRVFSKD